MKCRALYENNGKKNIVFFKSKGVRFPEEIRASLAIPNILDDSFVIYDSSVDDSSKYIVEEFPLPNSNQKIKIRCEFVKDDNDIFNSGIKNIIVEHYTGESLDYDTENLYFLSFNCLSEKKENPSSLDYIEFASFSFKFNKEPSFYPDDIEFKKFCMAIKADYNYADKQEGVAYSLTQRLSIIKGELWYLINYGLPLLDKVKSGEVFDSVIISIILNHPDVTNIVSFSSSIDKKHVYRFNVKISTIYNQDIELSNIY